MTAQPETPASAKQSDSKSIQSSAALGFVLSLLLHGFALFLTGGVVLFYAPIPKTTFESPDAQWVDAPAQMDEAPVLEEVQDPALQEPTPTETLTQQTESLTPSPETPVDTRDIILSTGPSPAYTFLPSAPTLPAQTSTQPTEEKPSEAKAGAPISKQLRSMKSIFGNSGAQANEAFIGYLYDLKQTPDRKPTDMAPLPAEKTDINSVQNNAYDAVLNEFLDKRWDPKVLEKYFRAPKPLAAYQICIPTINASVAPEAFDVAKYVEPRRWVIHYKGVFSAPRSTKIRFCGQGDDVMVVRFRGDTVMNGSYARIKGVTNSNEEPRNTPLKWNYSNWINIKEGSSYPIEVLIGERPGGVFRAFLLVQEDNVNYPPVPGGLGVILPVFQTAPTRIPSFEADKYQPPVAKEGFVFNVVEK
ncbi:MAG: hypothetical protein SFU85_07385 [Candidatus Methylacidiphilales bacterium]|nr:hypothetical protein [Candidatus Methylacidiphilales bacterium]